MFVVPNADAHSVASEWELTLIVLQQRCVPPAAGHAGLQSMNKQVQL